ncbi:MAG: family 43 glycosylhydrolase [Acutalibacteraceae bacterium]|jgi:xylan 1,4-beta-xylosidase
MKRISSLRLLAVCCAALLLLAALPIGASAATTGRDYEDFATVALLQQPGQIARVALAAEGLAEVTVTLPAAASVRGHDPAGLMLVYELRVTRDDGVTGAGSLSKVVNGWTKLHDQNGSECYSSLQPVQQGVATDQRVAGNWMPVALPLSAMSSSVTAITKLRVADYNDFPKSNPPVHTGITYEVRSARIVDRALGADGTPAAEYAATLKEQLADLLAQPFPADAPARLTSAYNTAKAQAQSVVANANAGLGEVSTALKALRGAMIADDKTALQAVADEPIDRAAYSDNTLAAYVAALAQAQTLLSEIASNAEIEAASAALRDAIDGLTEREIPDIVYGDVDAKDGITAADALQALQASTGKIQLTTAQTAAGNVDGKSGVTAADALIILQLATGKIVDATPAAIPVSVNETPTTICNPINLNYMYSYSIDIGTYQITDSLKSREAADPAVVIFDDEYYLFASHNDGYWVSKDLADWEFIRLDTEKFPWFRKFAPATVVVGDTLYVTFSEGGDLMKTTDPRNPDAWVHVGPAAGWVDPALFYDDPADGGDGYVYAFTGLSPDAPIRVCRLDPKQNLKKISDWVDCFNSDKDNHGFEVPGNDNTNYNGSPYLEGAWLNKHGGKYYLTYAIPGTGDKTYCDGCYVADDPMGPYTFCENSPVVWKASGYAVGAGHGCLFEDLNGNWWKVDTVSIMTTGWERRLAIFPASFDADGDLFTNTVFGDYPMYVPTAASDPFAQPGPGWNLLSYGKKASASSSLKDTRFAFDESIRSWWSAETGNTGEWLQVDLGRVYRTRSLQINFADQNIDPNVYGRDNDFHYEYLAEFSQDGTHWYPLVDRTDNQKDMPHDYIEFEEAVLARYIRVTNKGAIPANGKFAVSGLRVFGDGEGVAPAAPGDVSVNRYPQNERSATISWTPVKGAQGYIVRFGTKEGALHNHYQVIGDNSVTLNCLNKGVDYYFRVDAYNESGITLGTTVIPAPFTQAPGSGGEDEPDPPTPEDAVKKEAGYAVYEAENSHFGNTTPPSGATVGAYDDAGASGGKTLHNLEHAGAYFEFTGVNGGEGGDATLTLAYMNGNASSKTEIFVNGESMGLITIPGTGSWQSFKMVRIPISGLTPGATNTIRFEGGHEGYNPDFIQVLY